MIEKHRKWVTREKAKVDRIACPWLIKNFVDSKPEFLFVPAEKVLDISKEQNAIPFDVPDVELGHHDNTWQCKHHTTIPVSCSVTRVPHGFYFRKRTASCTK